MEANLANFLLTFNSAKPCKFPFSQMPGDYSCFKTSSYIHSCYILCKMHCVDELVKSYGRIGFRYKEIISLLGHLAHSVEITLRTLKRWYKSCLSSEGENTVWKSWLDLYKVKWLAVDISKDTSDYTLLQ